MEEYKDGRKGHNTYVASSYYERKPFRSEGSGAKWDYIVRCICLGCGKTLSDYDNWNGYAFCFNCRRFLFPWTIPRHLLGRKRSPSRY